MKKNLLFIFAVLFTFSAQAQNTLKLMSYNIKNANGMDNVCTVSYTHLTLPTILRV